MLAGAVLMRAYDFSRASKPKNHGTHLIAYPCTLTKESAVLATALGSPPVLGTPVEHGGCAHTEDDRV
jgi:hypothetical protein